MSSNSPDMATPQLIGMSFRRASLTFSAIAFLLYLLVQTSTASEDVRSDFEQVVQPYFKSNCIKCHGERKQKGNLALHTIAARIETDEEVDRWLTILEKLMFKEMPPPKQRRQPDPLETAQVLS